MAGFGVKAPTTVKARAIKNANMDRSTRLRAPRLKQLSVGTRDYAKPEMSMEQPLAFGGGGFGQTGMTGES